MKQNQLTQKEKNPNFEMTVERLHAKAHQWISEIEFINIEQNFLKELLTEHILELCTTHNFEKAKLLLNGIEHESKLGNKLIESIKEHKINLALLTFRNNHKLLKMEVKNYIENFKYIKEQVFELVLLIMKNEKEKKLLSK